MRTGLLCLCIRKGTERPNCHGDVFPDAECRVSHIQNPPVVLNEVGGPPYSNAPRSGTFVCANDLPCGVGKQRKGQCVGFPETCVRTALLRADAADLRGVFQELRMPIPECTGLARAYRGEVGGVEIKQYAPVAQQCRQTDLPAVLIR